MVMKHCLQWLVCTTWDFLRKATSRIENLVEAFEVAPQKDVPIYFQEVKIQQLTCPYGLKSEPRIVTKYNLWLLNSLF